MALLDSEVSRIRYELGYTNMVAGAYPYIGSVFASFNTIVQTYLDAGATTTSATAVTAVASGAAPAPVALTLASATGFAAKVRVIIDVDSRQEGATVESLSGSAITVLLRFAHAGTYPVTVEGGETIVREILRKLQLLTDPVTGRLEKAASTAGIASVDKGDVVFFPGSKGSRTRMSELQAYQSYLRDELASALGCFNARRMSGGAVAEMY